MFPSLWLGWMVSIHGMNIKPYLTFATGIVNSKCSHYRHSTHTNKRNPKIYGCTLLSESGWIRILASNQTDFIVVWFLVNWTQMKQRILYNVFLPSFLPGCESELSVSRSKDSEFLSRSTVVVQTGWEKEDVQAEPVCRNIEASSWQKPWEMLVLTYCVQKLLIVLYVRGSVVSASPEKVEGWG